MVTAIILFQLAIVLTLIFIGARVGGIGLGIYGVVGGIHTCFRFLTSTWETTHRRDAHHHIGDNGSRRTASGRRT